MKSYRPIGKLDKPTLVYTMGVLLYSLPNIGKYINDIQDNLKDDYPSYTEMELAIGGPSFTDPTKIEEKVVKQYVLNNPDSTWGLMFSQDRITLHTKNYEGFADFAKKFRIALQKFFEITGLKYYSGIAFRHIDNIIPMEGKESLLDCVKERFVPPTIPDEENHGKNGRVEYKYRLGARNLISRLYTFEDGLGPVVPQDLFPNYISLNLSSMKKSVKSPYILADFEANNLYGGVSRLFNLDESLSELDSLHKYASYAFREFMREDALKRRGMK